MKLLATITDEDIGLKSAPVKKFTLRIAARAIIFDDKKKIAMMYVSKYVYHKLPGGGLEEGESLIQGLAREIKEETGCEITKIRILGKIIEYRKRYRLKQTSYCYKATLSDYGKQKLTKKEKIHGFKLQWLSIDQAIERIKKEAPNNYEGKFIVKRDRIFLEEAKKMSIP
jgi:8-oxo-dGTP diphosphatase